MPKPLRFREVWQRLSDHDSRFEVYTKRGKGSEVMLSHPDVNGRAECIPVTNHKGRDVGKGLLKAVIRRFNLPGDIFD
ncbi:MAG: type II toxin-antitoxin system HicA family toxin [Chthoniobacterales bacterium]